MSPLVLWRGRDFLCLFFNALKNIWLKTIIFLPLDKWGAEISTKKSFTVGVDFSVIFQQSNIEG